MWSDEQVLQKTYFTLPTIMKNACAIFFLTKLTVQYVLLYEYSFFNIFGKPQNNWFILLWNMDYGHQYFSAFMINLLQEFLIQISLKRKHSIKKKLVLRVCLHTDIL